MLSQNQVIPDATNYKVVSEVCPRYRYLKLTLNNVTTGSIVLQPSSNTQLEFKLPSTDVYNLSKSIIAYESTYGDAANNARNVAFEDVPELFNNVSMVTSSGVNIMNLTAANNFLKIKRRQETKNEDFLNGDVLSSLYPSNRLTDANLRAVPEAVPVNVYRYPASTPGPGPLNLPLADQYNAYTSYTEPQHLTISAQEVAGNHASAMFTYRQYSLGMFKDTYLGLDKDTYIPTDTYLRINVSAPKMGFNSTTATAFTKATTGVLANNLTLNNICLYVAIEQNIDIVDSLKTKFLSSGLKYQIPDTQTFRTSTNGAGTIGVQIQMNRGYGKTIKKIMHTVWNVDEQGNTAYDCSNWNGSRLQTYRTYLNSRQLQDQDLSCLVPSGQNINQDDWLFNKKYYRKAAVMNAPQYQLNAWSHTDAFCEPQNEHCGVPEDNISGGYPILEPVTWALQGQSNVALIHYTYVTFLRDMHITPSGNIVEIL